MSKHKLDSINLGLDGILLGHKMKFLFYFIFLFIPYFATADCQTSNLGIREVVKDFLETHTKINLDDAYWVINIKNNKTSDALVQYGIIDEKSQKEKINNHLVSISCDEGQSFVMDSYIHWSILKENLPPLNKTKNKF